MLCADDAFHPRIWKNEIHIAPTPHWSIRVANKKKKKGEQSATLGRKCSDFFFFLADTNSAASAMESQRSLILPLGVLTALPLELLATVAAWVAMPPHGSAVNNHSAHAEHEGASIRGAAAADDIVSLASTHSLLSAACSVPSVEWRRHCPAIAVLLTDTTAQRHRMSALDVAWYGRALGTLRRKVLASSLAEVAMDHNRFFPRFVTTAGPPREFRDIRLSRLEAIMGIVANSEGDTFGMSAMVTTIMGPVGPDARIVGIPNGTLCVHIDERRILDMPTESDRLVGWARDPTNAERLCAAVNDALVHRVGNPKFDMRIQFVPTFRSDGTCTWETVECPYERRLVESGTRTMAISDSPLACFPDFDLWTCFPEATLYVGMSERFYPTPHRVFVCPIPHRIAL